MTFDRNERRERVTVGRWVMNDRWSMVKSKCLMDGIIDVDLVDVDVDVGGKG